MSRFSLKDACVVVLVVSLLTGSWLVGCGSGLSSARQTAIRMQNGTQVRGVQQAFVLFAQGNNGFYPGLDAGSGKAINAIAPSATQYGAAAPSNTDISAVYAILLNGEFFTTEYIISPVEKESKTMAPAVSSSHTITRADYSYALLQFGNEQGNEGRREEWKETMNSQAPVVADRSKAIDSTMKTTSLFTEDTSGQSTAWQGNVAWNDNHVTFENSGVMGPQTLRMGGTVSNAGGTPVPAVNDVSDDLFKANDGGILGADRNAMFSFGQ